MNASEKSYMTKKIIKDMNKDFLKEDISSAIQYLLMQDDVTKITKARICHLSGIRPQRINDILSHEHERLIRKENKTRPFSHKSKSLAFQKFKYGQEVLSEMSVKEQCDFLKISMKTYYQFKSMI